MIEYAIYMGCKTRTYGKFTDAISSGVSHSEVWSLVYDRIWFNPAVRGHMGMPGQIGACVELKSR